MSTLLICRGLPASGKTTWARKWVAEDPANRVRVNRDSLRWALFQSYHDGVDESVVTVAQHAAIKAALDSGKDVVSDDTNLSKFVKDLVKIASENGHYVEWHDQFLDVDVRTCIDRDRNTLREIEGKSVGSDVIMSFYNRYLKNGRPKRPQVNEVDLSGFAPYTGTPGAPEVFLVDLDGTIAHNNGHRSFYDETKVSKDEPVEVIIRIVQGMEAQGLKPIFVSGRGDGCYNDTFGWILKHVYAFKIADPQELVLHMRTQGDQRRDSIVKLEIFDRYIRNNYDVKFALDDRNQVVRAYRDVLGLTVLQVRDGDF